MAKKYDLLNAYLNKTPYELQETTLSFSQTEQILGNPLPPSAHEWRPWWANQADTSNRPQAAARLSAGWKVDTVNQDEK